MFSVIVSDIGTVYDGNEFAEAEATYDKYVQQSNNQFGTSTSSEVILMANGEVEFHYEGMTCSCDKCGFSVPRQEAVFVSNNEFNFVFCTERCKVKKMKTINLTSI